MRRGLAITVVYLILLAIPALLIALIVPPLITEADNFANNVPQYADDVTQFVRDNETLRNLNEDYDITGKLEEEAGKLPNKIGDAAGVLRDVGFGLVTERFEHAVARLVGWDLDRRQPLPVHVAEEVVARLDRPIHLARVDAEGAEHRPARGGGLSLGLGLESRRCGHAGEQDPGDGSKGSRGHRAHQMCTR